jgi:type IV secretory pathway VirB2 component (pilin)
MMISENRRSKAHLDLSLILLTYLLAIFGVLAVTIATYPVNSDPQKTLLNHIVESLYGQRQAIFLLISPIILGVIASFRYENLRLLSRFFYYVSLVLLFLVLITSRASGVKAWMDTLWNFTIQPSEFAKLGMIMILARILSRESEPMSTWKGFLRIFSVQNGILSFQTPSEEDGKIITSGVDQDNIPSLRDEADDDTNDLTNLSSAEELLAISTAGDKAFKPLLDKYTFQSGNLYRTETDDLLNLTFLDGSGNDLNIQISTVNKEYLNHVASSVFFEIDDGSQKNVRIGDDTVITCTNLDVNTVQWVTQYGYCHLWSKASHEELLNIAKMLLDAGLKPV